jgi:hypothetical protein
LVNKLDKYKILLPEGFKRPMVSEGLINNRVTFYSTTKSNPTLNLVSQSNWQKLTITELNKLKYPAYEMSTDSDFFEGEKIDSSQMLTFGQKDFLEVKSSTSNSSIYRLLTTYNSGNSVFIIEFKLDKSSMNLYDGYKIFASALASSFSEYK